MEKYNITYRLLHWVLAAMIITLIAVGVYMADLPKDYPGKYDMYDMHKSFGLIAMFLIFGRIINRLVSSPPPLPESISKFDVMVSKISNFTLYILMLIIPVSGYVMSVASGYGAKVFGIALVEVMGKDAHIASVAHGIHVNIWYLLVLFILLHLAGNVKHYAIDKVNILKRML